MRRMQEDIPADISAFIRVGTIASVDLAEARCTVLYGDPDDPQAAETPPIRWLTPRAGETRIWSPPSVGEQVLLISPDGQVEASIAVPGIVRDAFPPLGADTTEMIEFSDGAQISYDPQAHALTAILPGSATAEIDAPGGITLRGDVTIEGDVQIMGTGAITGDLTSDADVIASGTSLTGHVHKSVQSGNALSGPPD